MKKEHPLAVRWSAFPLHPETPAEGRSLEALFAGRNVNIQEMMVLLQKTAAAEGLPFGSRAMTYNSRLAQELGKWAESQGRGEAFHLAAFRAYFVEGANIAQEEILIRLAASAALDEAQANRALRERSFKAAVDEDWRRAFALGITAVPTFIMNGRRLVGAQPYDALLKFVTGQVGL